MPNIAACQDLPTPQFWSKPITHFGVIALFSSKCPKFYISKTIRDRGKVETAKMFSMSRSTKISLQLKMCDNCVKSYSSWNAFYCRLTAFGYSNNQREAKCEVGKAKFWESLTYMFFTAILITYIKGGTPAHICFGEGICNDEGYICYFITEVIKFYWLMFLLYPGELYRLLGASSIALLFVFI